MVALNMGMDNEIRQIKGFSPPEAYISTGSAWGWLLLTPTV
jgi:hypothetical protein